MDPAVLGHPCTFESMWHVFVCFAIRVTSAGTTGETSIPLSFLIVVLLFHCGIERKLRTKSTK